jgi:hypothetical protein
MGIRNSLGCFFGVSFSFFKSSSSSEDFSSDTFEDGVEAGVWVVLRNYV